MRRIRQLLKIVCASSAQVQTFVRETYLFFCAYIQGRSAPAPRRPVLISSDRFPCSCISTNLANFAKQRPQDLLHFVFLLAVQKLHNLLDNGILVESRLRVADLARGSLTPPAGACWRWRRCVTELITQRRCGLSSTALLIGAVRLARRGDTERVLRRAGRACGNGGEQVENIVAQVRERCENRCCWRRSCTTGRTAGRGYR